MSTKPLLPRVHKAVLRMMRSPKRKSPVSKEIADAAARQLARWLLKQGAVSLNGNRISIERLARTRVLKAARMMGWMQNPAHQHGQQAGKCAAKTLGSIRNGRISGEQLLERCTEFGQLRKRHIDRKSANRPRTSPREIQLAGHGLVARWLTSEVDLDHVGHAMRNCLADQSFAKDYKRQLRNRDIEMITIGDNGSPVVLISANVATRAVEDVAGPSNKRPVAYRAAIIETLVKGDFQVGENQECLQIAVCDELLHACRTETVRRFSLLKRECEVGEGFIAIMKDDDTVLLRNKDWLHDMYIAHAEGNASEVMQQSATRNWLRKACRQNAQFAQACRDAFRSADKAIQHDWFGVTRTTAP